MSENTSLIEEEHFKWSWLSPGIEKKNNTYYNRVLAVRSSDGSRRVFETGDTVYVANNVEQVWIAQIVELYQKGVCLEDEECELVSEAFATSSQMRCTLRWFYNADDESIKDSKRVSPHIPSPKRNEIYFSDHVEFGDTNPLEVIEGRAFLCSTDQETMRLNQQHPKDYWDGDVIRLVRCFYGYNAGNPPPIRELGKRELELYLKNPSKDPDLYNRSRLSLYGRHGAVMKGTGQKKRHQYNNYLDITRLSTSEISTSEDGDHTAYPSGTADASGLRIGMSIVNTSCQNQRRSSSNKDNSPYGDSTEKFSISDIEPSPSTVRLAEAQNSMAKKTINLQSHLHNSQLSELENSMEKPTESIDGGEMEGNSGSAEKFVIDCKEIKAQWRMLRETLEKGTREQQEHCFSSIPKMLILFRKIMEEHSLGFNMDENSKEATASAVANKIFGSTPPPPDIDRRQNFLQ